MWLFKSAYHPAKPDPAERVLALPLPPPRPAQKKTFHNLPKTPSHKASKSPMLCPMGRFPEQPPSANELRGPRRGFVPGTNKRPRVSTVKNTHSKPSCHRTGTTTKHFPHQTQPDACPRNGPGLPTHPPQSGGQPPHLPLLPRTGVKKPTRRQDSKSHESFFFFFFVNTSSLSVIIFLIPTIFLNIPCP